MLPESRRTLVGIDASRMNGAQRTGTENYSNQIIRGLLETDTEWTWRLYLNADRAPRDLPGTNVENRTIPSSRFWTHCRLSREMVTSRPDILFVPSHVVPLIHPRSVVTIHDLGYLYVPDAHTANQRRILDLTTRWSARAARHIIVPSAQTQADLTTHYDVPEDKISIIHHGVDSRYRDVKPGESARVAQKFQLERPYVLAVGTIQPRKNLPSLADAVAAVDSEHDLVIAGKRGWMADQVITDLLDANLGDRLRLLDYVPDEDLPGLYARAELFVQPSRFEGFGMPVIEAMAAGTAVVSAKGSSLDEIAGDGAVFFDPGEELALRDVLAFLLDNKEALRVHRERALSWSSRFCWEHAARKTRIILEQVLNS